MNKISKNIIVSSAVVATLLSSTYALSNIAAKAGQKAPNITAEQLKAKEDNKVKVKKAVDTAGEDIVSTFKINKTSYTKLDLSDMPAFSKGNFQGFSDITFCEKVTTVVNIEMAIVQEGTYKPVILVNNKEVIFAYKDLSGKNYIKKYELNNNGAFEKKLEDSISSKQIKGE